MKTIAILLAASLSLAACATDEEPGQGGRPPLGKPLLVPSTQLADIEESFELSNAPDMPRKDFDDGRLVTAETVGQLTLLHRFNETLGIDEIAVLDEARDTVKCCFTLRGQLTEIDHAGVK